MKFICERDCMIQVPNESGTAMLVNLNAKAGLVYEDAIDYTKYSKWFRKVGAGTPTTAPEPRDEWIGEPEDENKISEPDDELGGYDVMTRTQLVALANKRGIKGANKLSTELVIKQLEKYDTEGSEAQAD